MPKSAIKVIQDATAEPVPTEVLAESVKAISQGVRKLRAGSLNDRALFLLVQDACPTKVGLSTIRDVFNGIDSLERQFIRKKP